MQIRRWRESSKVCFGGQVGETSRAIAVDCMIWFEMNRSNNKVAEKESKKIRNQPDSGMKTRSSSHSSHTRIWVYAFWLVIGVLFVTSYWSLISKKDILTPAAEQDDELVQQSEEVVSPTLMIDNPVISVETAQQQTMENEIELDVSDLTAVAGIYEHVRGIRISSNLNERNYELTLAVQLGMLKLSIAESSTTITLRGTLSYLNSFFDGTFKEGHVQFLGTADTVLEVILQDEAGLVHRKSSTIKIKPIKDLLDENVTLLIKTHERPTSLDLLLTSIRQFYPTIKIFIADDSRNTKFKTDLVNIDYFPLSYDVGLSAARNYMVDRVQTKYFVTLDDDFIFTPETKLENWLQILGNNEIDLVAGSLYTDTSSERYDYAGKIAIEGTDFRLLKEDDGQLGDSDFPSCKRVDIVANFFMADTKKIQEIQWDSKLKLGEHQDFFYRAKLANLRIAACPDSVVVLHRQDHTDPDYKQKRGREVPYIREFLKKHGLKRFILYSGIAWVWTLD